MKTNSMLLHAEACFANGLEAEHAGDLGRATQLYEQMIAIHPSFAPPYVNLGAIHFQAGNPDRAAGMFKRACEADPNYPLAFFNYGNVLDDLGMIDEAATAYRRAVALDPRYADALYNLALICERKGQYREALSYWRSYLALEKTGDWAEKACENVQKILDRHNLCIVSRTQVPKRNFIDKAALCLVK